jgi:PAS domain-containing protein
MGGQSPDLAAWLISRRIEIEQVMAARLGPAAPSPAAAESEVLRRFRSFAAAALKRGTVAEPALDGLKANERRVTALLTAWCDAAAHVAGNGGEPLREALQPLVVRFRASLRTTGSSRRSRGAPAVDADSGRIVDANPAAGALLGVARDALLDVEATAFVPTSGQGVWWTHFDAMTEGGEARRFSANLRDVAGSTIPVECTITRFSTRDRTLALILARPL